MGTTLDHKLLKQRWTVACSGIQDAHFVHIMHCKLLFQSFKVRPQMGNVPPHQTVLSHSLNSHDSITIKINTVVPRSNMQNLTSRSKAMNTTFIEVKQVLSPIIWNLEQSKANDHAKRHAHDIKLVESGMYCLKKFQEYISPSKTG